MPGDNPQEAVTAFLQPLKAALGVLDGRGVIAVPRQGLWVKYRAYSWVLNAGQGMKLGGIGTLHASMKFQVIETDPATNDFGKPLRVTTLAYNYKLEPPGGSDLWRMHWHPDGRSEVREPHLHTPPDLDVHRPCDRMTFETAIRWCIEDGAPLTCAAQEAEDQLLVAETPHKLHRTWSSPLDRPELRRPQA
ncbi:MAG: hypothetical protein ACRDOJ_07305 [Nocardioidaceae bacterium]